MTINCAERGLLLLRVRDEMRMTIMAYQTLYESSIAFGAALGFRVYGRGGQSLKLSAWGLVVSFSIER